MPRQPFYEVPSAAYLFPGQSNPVDKREHPEEAVRQWCAYELIRAYGVMISELEFEHPVRVGSKTYRIDTLVRRRGAPWIVVECKPLDHGKPEEGMNQAVSYADAQEIRAEFAVYTNGRRWNVQRRVQGNWVPVSDIPVYSEHQAQESLAALLLGLDVVAPLLYKLDEPIEGDDALRFLSAMQVFFYGTNQLTQSGDRDLLFATDNLLRVLASAGDHPGYRVQKLEAARRHFEDYRQRTGVGFEILPITGQHVIGQEMQYLWASLSAILEGAQGLIAADMLLLRLNVALTQYGRLQGNPKQLYPRIDAGLHGALRGFLDFALQVHLNVRLPDPLDRITVGDMKSHCRPAWERVQR